MSKSFIIKQYLSNNVYIDINLRMKDSHHQMIVFIDQFGKNLHLIERTINRKHERYIFK